MHCQVDRAPGAAGKQRRKTAAGLAGVGLGLALWLAGGAGPEARGQEVALPPDPLQGILWEHGLEDFGELAYGEAVEAFFRALEKERGYAVQPGAKGRAGIKVYTNSGPGIATPVPLVRAVVGALERRGFARNRMLLVDLDEYYLREAGFLPSLLDPRRDFEGVPVLVLETGRYYDPAWFYDSPLPAAGLERRSRFEEVEEPVFGERADGRAGDRKSLLPVPLLLEVDFWINLPMVLDHPAVGVSGALTNPTLWAVSNNRRFLVNKATAPAATVEMAAVPELREKWLMTILTLQNFQFIGGPVFHSLYTRSEPVVWMSTNPVILDYLALEKINSARRETGFDMLMQEQPLFYYAETIGLGVWDPTVIRRERLGAAGGAAGRPQP